MSGLCMTPTGGRNRVLHRPANAPAVSRREFQTLTTDMQARTERASRLEEQRLNIEDLHEHARQARERATTRCREARILVHEVREARALRATNKR
jgi:hypothetical protein